MTVVLSRSFAEKFIDYLEKSNIDKEVAYAKNSSKVFVSVKADVKKEICDILSDFVINGYIKKYVNSVLNTEFYFFEKNEKEEVVLSVLSGVEKDDISRRIAEFFEANDQMMLDGFYKFRMKDFLENLDILIDDAAGEMALKKEYKEFIKLLKYFVSIGDSACDTAHIICTGSDYLVLDKNKKSPVDALDVMYEFADFDYSPEDELLSTLVSIAPRRVVIHGRENFKNTQILTTIQEVFENSIEFCGGKCSFCREIIASSPKITTNI